MGTFEESGEADRLDPDGGESMTYGDDSNSIDQEQTPDPHPGPTEGAGPAGWLDALNSFLEGAFLKADVDTGC